MRYDSTPDETHYYYVHHNPNNGSRIKYPERNVEFIFRVTPTMLDVFRHYRWCSFCICYPVRCFWDVFQSTWQHWCMEGSGHFCRIYSYMFLEVATDASLLKITSDTLDKCRDIFQSLEQAKKTSSFMCHLEGIDGICEPWRVQKVFFVLSMPQAGEIYQCWWAISSLYWWLQFHMIMISMTVQWLWSSRISTRYWSQASMYQAWSRKGQEIFPAPIQQMQIKEWVWVCREQF